MAATFAREYQLVDTHLGFVQNKRSFIWFGYSRACMWFWLKAELGCAGVHSTGVLQQRALPLSLSRSASRSLSVFLFFDLASVESKKQCKKKKKKADEELVLG